MGRPEGKQNISSMKQDLTNVLKQEAASKVRLHQGSNSLETKVREIIDMELRAG